MSFLSGFESVLFFQASTTAQHRGGMAFAHPCRTDLATELGARGTCTTGLSISAIMSVLYLYGRSVVLCPVPDLFTAVAVMSVL